MVSSEQFYEIIHNITKIETDIIYTLIKFKAWPYNYQ